MHHSGGNLRVPEKIIKNIFDLTNQLREEYKIPLLHFSKDLSFLAGEHACNMSTGKVSYGHTGYDERKSQVPSFLTFSENISVISASNNPAQDIFVSWIARPRSFSRLISSFTHTGIGVSESDEGGWYCCQIFATIKTKYNHKENLWLVARFANRQRTHHDLLPLSINMIATGKLLEYCSQRPDNVLSLTQEIVFSFFPHCHEAEYFIETLPASTSNLIVTYIQKLKEHGNGLRTIRKDLNEIAFLAQETTDGQILCILALAKCGNIYGRVPRLHIHYVEAYHFIQLLNDYRAAHNLPPFRISHRLSAIAYSQAEKMAAKEIPMLGAPIARKLEKMFKAQKDSFSVGAALIFQGTDVPTEMMASWSSNHNSRLELLGSGTDCGFGFTNCIAKTICVVRIIGIISTKAIKETNNPEENVYPTLVNALPSKGKSSKKHSLKPQFSKSASSFISSGSTTTVTDEVIIAGTDNLQSEYYCLTSDDEDSEKDDELEDPDLTFTLAN